MNKIKIVLFVIISFCSYASLYSQDVYKLFPANDPNIVIKGAMYLTKNADSVIIDRHSKAFLTTASSYFSSSNSRTQSGVVLSFKTSSPKVRVNFRKRADGAQRELRFAVYRDKQFLGYNTSLLLNMTALAGNQNSTTWDIVFPFFFGVNFKSIELLENYTIETPDVDTQKKYIAIGNSITHGVGQSGIASEKTYPFILANAKDWQLYNLAVSGSRITDLIADDTAPIKADVITILWGYNDWNNSRNIVADVIPRYKLLISKLRAYHPAASIYCIMPTATTTLRPESGTETTSIDTLRNTQRRVVNEYIAAGDTNLFVIEGGLLTTSADLRSGDPVHLSNDGANHLAQELIDFVNKTKVAGTQQPVSMEKSKIKVSILGKNVLISNGLIGSRLNVYDLKGSLILKRILKSSSEQFSLREKGVYIIKTNNDSIKIVV